MRTRDNFLCEFSSTASDDYTASVTLFGWPGRFLMFIAHASLLQPALSISQRRQLKARTCRLVLSRRSGIQSAPRRRIHNAPLQQGQWSPGRRIYFAFEPAFFLRSVHRFFINSDSFLRPAALSLLTRFAFGAFAVTARLGCRFGCAAASDPLRILRADVSLAISASS